MKIWLASIVMMAMLVACAPYRIEYRQLVLDDSPGLVVHERSRPEDSTYGKEVKHQIHGLPLKSSIGRESYVLTINTPLNGSTPVIFVGARTSGGEQLKIEGPHLQTVHHDALVIHQDDPYTFNWKLAGGAPLEFVVRDASGRELGAERFTYRFVIYGVVTGIETI